MARELIEPWFSTRDNFAPSRDIWQFLKTFLVVINKWRDGGGGYYM